MKTTTKAEAKAKGFKTYTGKPCPKCHTTERYTNSDKCIECHKARNAARKRGKAKTGNTAKPAKSNAVVPSGPTDGGNNAAVNAEGRASAWGGLARRVKALIEKADKAADKAEQFYKSAGLTIKEIKEKYPNWEAIVRDECGIGRSRAYELISIADGRSTLAMIRASTNERQKIHKAKSQSVITDSPAEVRPPVIEGEEAEIIEKTPLTVIEPSGVDNLRLAVEHARLAGSYPPEVLAAAILAIAGLPTRHTPPTIEQLESAAALLMKVGEAMRKLAAA